MDQKGDRGRRPPPALPPRQSSSTGQTGPQDDAPPPYELVAHQQRAFEKATAGNPSGSGSALGHNDPRSSSQQSLAPEPGEQNQRRTLLLIYIHGFMGNETSFRSFPAHLHNLLAVLLEETHVIHTKIYPRYRSKGHISHARDDFSKWLDPHESDSTDVVLLGHSMGGLLSAEVVLMPSMRPASRPLNHRIIGTINFDVPFLGMHPGVVKSGLASIFKSDEPPGDKWEDQPPVKENAESSQGQRPITPSSRSDTFWDHADPNFNPKFTNDVVLPVRKGWKSALHFVNKHSDDLIKSTKKLISSHMEFGGAMANYGELKTRYSRIRALEVEDGRVRQTVIEGGLPPRVRFVNYYTASTGRPKKPSSPNRRMSPSPHGSRSSSRTSVSCASLQSNRPVAEGSLYPTGAVNSQASLAVENKGIEALEAGHDTENKSHTTTEAESSLSEPTSSDVPAKPPPLGDLSYIQDPNIRKMVEDDHRKAVEKYEEALKKREVTSQDTAKPPEEPKRSAPSPPKSKPESEMTHSESEELRLERERQRMEAEARRLRGEKDPPEEPTPARPSFENIPRIESRAESLTASTVETGSTYDNSLLTPQESRENAPAKPKKDRKFCNLPPKDSNGERDPCWVRVLMKDVDEVGAHCGLFFVDSRYERLVGDVAERIERWVNEDTGLRASRANEEYEQRAPIGEKS